MPGLFRFGTLRQQPQRWPECKDRCESSKRYQKHMKTQVSGISGSPACCGGATFGRSSNSRTETPGSSIASGGNYFVIPGRSWKPHTHTPHTHTRSAWHHCQLRIAKDDHVHVVWQSGSHARLQCVASLCCCGDRQHPHPSQPSHRHHQRTPSIVFCGQADKSSPPPDRSGHCLNAPGLTPGLGEVPTPTSPCQAMPGWDMSHGLCLRAPALALGWRARARARSGRRHGKWP